MTFRHPSCLPACALHHKPAVRDCSSPGGDYHEETNPAASQEGLYYR